MQLSTAVTVEESVELAVTLSKKPSAMTASSLEKSKRSSTVKFSVVLCFSGEYWPAPPAPPK